MVDRFMEQSAIHGTPSTVKKDSFLSTRRLELNGRPTTGSRGGPISSLPIRLNQEGTSLARQSPRGGARRTSVDARSLLFILLDFALSYFAEVRSRSCTVQARRSFF